MTDREKIIKVIKQASEQAYADFHELFREGVKRVRDGEISRFTNRDVRPTHDEILADALIAAGIGDTTNIIVENKVLQRALLTTCVKLIEDEVDNVNAELFARVVYTKALRKAKKEAEEMRLAELKGEKE